MPSCVRSNSQIYSYLAAFHGHVHCESLSNSSELQVYFQKRECRLAVFDVDSSLAAVQVLLGTIVISNSSL